MHGYSKLSKWATVFGAYVAMQGHAGACCLICVWKVKKILVKDKISGPSVDVRAGASLIGSGDDAVHRVLGVGIARV